jgi:DNA primase
MSDMLNSILEDFLGDCRGYNESNEQAKFDCPACSNDKNLLNGDGKGNLEINYSKGVFKCWSCKDTNHMSGHIPYLIKRFGSPKHLKQYQILKPEYKDDFGESIKIRAEVVIPETFTSLSKQYPYDPNYVNAMEYLRERNITQDIIDYYRLGYTSAGKHFLRIIIPSYNDLNELNYFAGRAFSWVKPKYKNCESDKSSIIFNEDKINWDSTIYLVEGPFDHIVTPNSIPLLGKYISPILFETLIEKARGNIVIVLDADAEKDAELLYQKLFYSPIGHLVKIVILPEDYDIALIHQEYGKRGIIKTLRTAKRLTEFKY